MPREPGLERPPWRLRAADAQMLGHEQLGPGLRAECPWLLTFAGPSPGLAAVREQVEARLPLLPQLRCRLVEDPLPVARPSWALDPAFDLRLHVRESDEPRYAGEAGWLRFIEHRMSGALDRRRPLWELWLLPPDEEGRFALFLYHHHALLDGRSGLQVLRVLLDPQTPENGRESPDTRALPSAGSLLRRDGVDAIEAVRFTGERLRDGLRNPRASARALAAEAKAVAAMVRILAFEPAPCVPELNRAIGPRRRATAITIPKPQLMGICHKAQCFPNAVYVTAVAGGLGHWLRSRGRNTNGLVLRGGAAVDCGGDARLRRLGNYFSGVQVMLPVAEMDELARLALVRAGAGRINQQAVRGANSLIASGALLPVQMLGTASAVGFGPRHFNVGVSHLAPPPGLGRLAGRELLELRSWTFLFDRHAMTFVAQLFRGQMTVNLLFDPDAIPDVDVLLEGLHLSLESLAAGADHDAPTETAEESPAATEDRDGRR